jgi:hypothetical protein
MITTEINIRQTLTQGQGGVSRSLTIDGGNAVTEKSGYKKCYRRILSYIMISKGRRVGFFTRRRIKAAVRDGYTGTLTIELSDHFLVLIFLTTENTFRGL